MTYRGQWTVEQAQDHWKECQPNGAGYWAHLHVDKLFEECYRLRRERETWQRIASDHLAVIEAIKALASEVRPGIQAERKGRLTHP